jgi:hypothetical protein
MVPFRIGCHSAASSGCVVDKSLPPGWPQRVLLNQLLALERTTTGFVLKSHQQVLETKFLLDLGCAVSWAVPKP